MFAAWILRYRTTYMAETLYIADTKLKSYNMRVAVEEKNKRKPPAKICAGSGDA